MKTILITFLVIPYIFCAQSSDKNQFIISGKVYGDSTNNINIVSDKNEVSELISTSEDGEFNDTLFLEDGEYVLAYGQSFFTFSLDRDLNVSISFDHDDLWSSAEFSGKDAGIMNYYFDQFILDMDLSEIMYHENINRLEEEAYIQTVDSVTNLKKDVVYRYETSLPNDFKKFELGNLEYWKLLTLNNYEHGRRWIKNEPSFNVSSNYPNVFANVSYDEEYLYSSRHYITYIKDYMYKKVVRSKKQNPELDTEIYLLELTKKEVSNPDLLNRLFTNYLYEEGKRTTNIEPFFELLKTGITDSVTLQELEKLKEQRKKTIKGADVSNFKLDNEKGQLVQLSDFRGSIVVIDVWASWCLPCIKEIPQLQEMKSRFEDDPVVFIGINAMDSKEDWLKTLEKEKMFGVQLFAPDSEITFFKDLMVTSLPRYILIDKKGKLLESRLIRPTSEKFYDRIKQELE